MSSPPSDNDAPNSFRRFFCFVVRFTGVSTYRETSVTLPVSSLRRSSASKSDASSPHGRQERQSSRVFRADSRRREPRFRFPKRTLKPLQSAFRTQGCGLPSCRSPFSKPCRSPHKRMRRGRPEPGFASRLLTSTAAVPPEGRIGRHPGIKQLGALRHGAERKESAERVAHEDVPQGFSFKAFGNFGLHGLLKAFHEFRGAPALSGLSGVSTIAADARARGRQEGGAVGHVDGRNGTGRCGALRARKQAQIPETRRAPTLRRRSRKRL